MRVAYVMAWVAWVIDSECRRGCGVAAPPDVHLGRGEARGCRDNVKTMVEKNGIAVDEHVE